MKKNKRFTCISTDCNTFCIGFKVKGEGLVQAVRRRVILRRLSSLVTLSCSSLVPSKVLLKSSITNNLYINDFFLFFVFVTIAHGTPWLPNELISGLLFGHLRGATLPQVARCCPSPPQAVTHLDQTAAAVADRRS